MSKLCIRDCTHFTRHCQYVKLDHARINMPKKTKRQKLLAEKHRQKLLNSQPVKNQINLPGDDQEIHPEIKYTFNKQSVPAVKPVLNSNEYSYVNKDLKRISLFTFLAISLQVVIYFVLKGS